MSAGKVMLAAFFDIQGPLLLAFKEPEVSIHAQHYTKAPNKVHMALKNKRSGMLSSDVIILHGNARMPVSKVYVEAIASKKWEVLEHPQFTAQICRLDYHIFEPLQKKV
ncbi:uncharacterized protein TNIN_413971 [Trichonephila inaurata madagascariensis]|uniref:Uncharacterized protein n=1 Tax=Trichonephila inaurata madagascariensis TaxID=2747483 RepID=A0A8X6XYS6_9ARAC|nr:uncharacterized protein TNIN_413971 [Trichonephila inaurata madagascariensis]